MHGKASYAILPEDLADDLNMHNDAYPLARSSQAAALATMEHEGKIAIRRGADRPPPMSAGRKTFLIPSHPWRPPPIALREERQCCAFGGHGTVHARGFARGWWKPFC